MARGIGWLAKDLKREIEKARADAGPIIIKALVEDGPWWTGTFGRSWELSDQPLKPTKERDGDWRSNTMPTSKNLPNVVALKLPLGSSLYIGNTVKYAGFAVNNPNATLDGKTYEEHGQLFKLTAKARNPDWFNVYTAHSQSAEILSDLTKAFTGRGFKASAV